MRQKRDVRMTVGRKGAKGKQEETKTDRDVEAFVSRQRAPRSVGPKFMDMRYIRDANKTCGRTLQQQQQTQKAEVGMKQLKQFSTLETGHRVNEEVGLKE